MNFLQLVQRLHRETLRSTAAPASVTTTNERHARLVDRISDAWLDLQREADWRWMRETLDSPLTIGKQTYSGAELGVTRFGRWRADDDTYTVRAYVPGAPNTLWDLVFWQLDDFRRRFIYIQQGATTPIAWTVDEANNLLVGPQPAAAYQLRIEHWKEPLTLTADADTPDMPERFHMLLVWRALMDVAKDDAAPEQLSKAEENYAMLHGQLVRDQKRLPVLA